MRISDWSSDVCSSDLNVAAFYYKYKDLQVQINSGGFDLLTNAGAARNYGADIEGTLRLTPDFQISGGFAYLHARYRNYRNATVLVPNPGGGNTTVSGVDLSGFKVTRAPPWTLNTNAHDEQEFTFVTVVWYGNMYHI